MNNVFSLEDKRLAWLKSDVIRPYVFTRASNPPLKPAGGKREWFPLAPIIKNGQAMVEAEFTDQILRLENHVFGDKLAMPKWVFYDCAIMPGIITGYVIRREAASKEILAVTKPGPNAEWVPLSLFVVIPTMRHGEWVAHNLSSINSVLSAPDRLYGLGFLSKAFGLWYANITTCCGMTQWRGHAIKLHSRYGDFEVLTAYTPSHTVPETLTYRVKIEMGDWDRFFTDEKHERFLDQYEPVGWRLDRRQDSSLVAMQERIEAGEGPFFLNPDDISDLSPESELAIYRPR
jgi:hypothetical protein